MIARELRFALSLAYAGATDARLLMALTETAPTTGGSPAPEVPDELTATADRIHALVDLAKAGDAEAFGELYDHYATSVFRFVYYRVGSQHLAEDITSDTFIRAMRAIERFNWQGRDFGAWLTTIARNLIADHFKSSRVRLEWTAEHMPEEASEHGTDHEVLSQLTNDALYAAVKELPDEQRDCLLMRFIQGLSIAQTAEVLGRSEGAVKQLQLRAVRALAKRLPEELR